jgi:hypothetical protein
VCAGNVVIARSSHRFIYFQGDGSNTAKALPQLYPRTWHSLQKQQLLKRHSTEMAVIGILPTYNVHGGDLTLEKTLVKNGYGNHLNLKTN